MYPGTINPVPISFSVPSCFAVLDEVVMEGTGKVLVGILQKSRQRARRHIALSCALRISSVSASGDLGSEDLLTLSCFVNEDFPATCMVDLGASFQFIDLDFALNLNLPLVPKGKPEDLVLADGARSVIGQITYTCNLKLAINQHMEELTFQVTKLAGWNLIVGKPWLHHYNPTINWATNTIAFYSGYCHAHCLPTRPLPVPAPTNKFRISLILRATLQVAMKDPEARLCIMALCNDPSDTSVTPVIGVSKDEDLAKELVPSDYYDYLVLFSEKEARILPPSRYVDHGISLVEGAKSLLVACTLCQTQNLRR